MKNGDIMTDIDTTEKLLVGGIIIMMVILFVCFHIQDVKYELDLKIQTLEERAGDRIKELESRIKELEKDALP